MSLSLGDYADTELLAIILDISDDDGWSSTHDVAAQLGQPGDIRSVAIRLTWMKRYGWLERDGGRGWRLTSAGQMFVGKDLTASAQKTLDDLPPAQRVKAVRRLSESASSSASETRSMLRREWQRNFLKP